MSIPKGFIAVQPYMGGGFEIVAIDCIAAVGDTWEPTNGVFETFITLKSGKCVGHRGTVVDVVSLISDAQRPGRCMCQQWPVKEVATLREALEHGKGWECQPSGTGLGQWDDSVWSPCDVGSVRRFDVMHTGGWRVRKCQTAEPTPES